MSKQILGIVLLLVVGSTIGYVAHQCSEAKHSAIIEHMVREHARAWEIGDEALLASLLHDNVVFAYPGRRLTKEQTLEDLRFFRDAYTNTKVYIHNIIVQDDMVAVEWQFATTKKETGTREVVSDGVIGKIRDGKFIVWKEYLDGRVKGLQAEGKLEREEGQEPFPWPAKTNLF